MKRKRSIILVEDDRLFQAVITSHLGRANFEISLFGSGEEMLASSARLEPDLFLLDVMLPGMDGFEICRKIREYPPWKDKPILALTSLDRVVDRVKGLQSGADDYLIKPFDPSELLARIEALFRRANWRAEGESNRYVHSGTLTLDSQEKVAFASGEPLPLTPKEFDLLIYLVQNQGRILGRTELFRQVWGLKEDTETRTVDVHIRFLRKKLTDASVSPTQGIETLRGQGYRFA